MSILEVGGDMAEDLTIYQGRTWVRSWGLRLFGAQVDLGDYGVRAQARVDTGLGESGDLLVEWATDPTGEQLPITATNPVDKTYTVITMQVPPGESAAWTWRGALWDVEVYHLTDDSLVYSAMGDGPGKITVIPEVTRPVVSP